MSTGRASLLLITFGGAGCIPIPVSTVPLHPREERPVAVESAALVAEVWNLQSGQTISDLSCDAVTTSMPK